MKATNFLLLLSIQAPATLADSSSKLLLSFVDASVESFKWMAENDPVMGGVSESNITVQTEWLAWGGECKIVPSLEAPGFCIAQTYGAPILGNCSGFSHLSFTVRSDPEKPYQGFKIDFSTLLHPNTQFTSFKADFPAIFYNTSDTDDSSSFHTVTLPFTAFTWDWSSYTGEPIHPCGSGDNEKYCPSERDLSSITQIGFWAEGVEGIFSLDIQDVGCVSKDAN